MRRILLLAMLLSGCRRCGSGSAPDAGRATMWVSAPDTTSDFASVIEGPCLRLRASVLGSDVFLHDFGLVARWSGTAPIDAATLSRGAEGTRVGWIEGTFPDNAWLRYSSGSVGDHAMRWQTDHWVPTWGDATGPLFRFHITADGAVGAVGGVDPMVGVPRRPDVPLAPGDRVLDVGVRGDEAFALVDHAGALEARRVKKGVVTAIDALGATQIFVTPHGAFATGPTTFVWWNGTAWTRWASPPNVAAIDEDPSGLFWLLTDAKRILQMKTPGSFVDVTPPATVTQFAGARIGVPWAIAGDTVWRWDGAAWKKASLPKPSQWPTGTMTPAFIVVKNASEAWVQAEYLVDPFGTGPMPRSALLRLGPAPRTTLRCMPSERTDPIPGFVDWPPLADSACKAPFVVLAVSAKPTDWKSEIAALGTHPDGLVEFLMGPARYMGAPASSFEAAKELQKKGTSSASEIVCGTPAAPRIIR